MRRSLLSSLWGQQIEAEARSVTVSASFSFTFTDHASVLASRLLIAAPRRWIAANCKTRLRRTGETTQWLP